MCKQQGIFFKLLMHAVNDFNILWCTRSVIQALAASFPNNLPMEPINRHNLHCLKQNPSTPDSGSSGKLSFIGSATGHQIGSPGPLFAARPIQTASSW